MTEVEYVVCPLCGSNHPWNSEARRLRRGDPIWQWVNYNLNNFEFIQIRDAGGKLPGPHPDRRGRGSAPAIGFPKSYTVDIRQAYAHPVYRQAVDSLKQRILDIVRDLIQLEIMDRSEVLDIIG